jgi:hypothetical protein
MRNYVTEPNLLKAAGLSAVVTLMSAGRLVLAGRPLALYIPATFIAMTLVSGAVTAWGRYADMPGILTDRRTLLRGMAFAAALSLLTVPICVFWLDPILRVAFLHAGRPAVLDLAYPSSISGRLSLLLWSAGFQTLFLVAAPMSLFARLTGRPTSSVLLCLALRAYVSYRQITEAGMFEGSLLLAMSALLATAAGCFLFARFGLMPTMLFGAGLDLHLFLASPGGH